LLLGVEKNARTSAKVKVKVQQPKPFSKEEYFLSKMDIFMLARGLLVNTTKVQTS